MKSLGIRHALSPVLDIARDLRYGRIGETFGSDPTLTAEMVKDMLSNSNMVDMAGVKMETMDEDAAMTEEVRREYFRALCPGAKTIKEALEDQYGNVSYAKGFYVGGNDYNKPADFDEALRLAADSDVIIVCVGGKNGVGAKCTSGEGIDSTLVELPDGQEELVRRLYEVNSKMIIVHLDAKPLVGKFIYDNVPAILEGWIPCAYGGQAIADVISGKYNPCGHLPMDVPRSTGQTPYYYSQRNGSSIDSIRECTGDFIVNQDGYFNEKRYAQRPFGYGLSYTEFEYSDMTVSVGEDGTYHIETDVENIGDRDGAAVVQLYGADEYASVVRPYRELLGVCRVELAAKEKARIFFEGNINQFAFEDKDGRLVTEAGVFRFEISRDSETPVLTEKWELNETMDVNRSDLIFYARSGRLQ